MEPMAIVAIVLIGLLAWFMLFAPGPMSGPVPGPVLSESTRLSEELILSDLDDLLEELDEIEMEDDESFSNPECSIPFDSKIKTITDMHARAIATIEGLADGRIGMTVENLSIARDLFKKVRRMIQCARDEIKSGASKGNRPAMRKALKNIARVAKNKAKQARNRIRRRLNERSPGWRATIPAAK